MEILGLLLYFLLSILIGKWAAKWDRDSITWGVIAVLISPLIAAIVLLILGRDEKKIQEKQREKRLLEAFKEEEKEEKERQRQEKIEEEKRKLTANDFIISTEALKKLHEKEVLSDLDYQAKKNQLIDSLKSKILTEEKDVFMAALIPLVDSGAFSENDFSSIKEAISY